MPQQAPSAPTSAYYAGGSPSLHLAASSSLLVRVGAPAFDGGDQTTYFRIEGTSTPTSGSGAAGGALGAAVVPAGSYLCNGCVEAFDAPTRTFYYGGDDNDARELMPGSRVYVVFSDDDVGYTFTVATSTRARIVVEPGFDRVASANFTAKPDLRLEGAQYTIAGLDTGARYYVRVAAENRAAGLGDFAATSPASEVPRAAPGVPPVATADVAGAHAVAVSWSPPASLGAPVTGYAVEVMTAETFPSQLGSYFGRQEVQVVETFYTGGAYATYDVDYSRRRLASSGGDMQRGLRSFDGLYSYSFYGEKEVLSVTVTLTLDGIACADFGDDEEAVLKTAIANTTGYPASYIGPMTCSSARRLAEARRALLADSSAISFDLSIPGDEVMEDDVADATDLGAAITTTLETAIADGSLATAIARAASDAGVTTMSSVSVASITVLPDVPLYQNASHVHGSFARVRRRRRAQPAGHGQGGPRPLVPRGRRTTSRAYVARGDPIVVDGVRLTVHSLKPLNGTHVPTSEMWPGASGDSYLATTTQRTVDIAYDASADEFAGALEALPTVGSLRVTRSYDARFDGYSWTVTFLSDMGDLPALAPNGAKLLDGGAGTPQTTYDTVGRDSVRVRTVYDGYYPNDYVAYFVNDASATTTTVPLLQTGLEYHFRVRATSGRGDGMWTSAGSAVPAEAPGAIAAVSAPSLERYADGKLRVSFEQTAPPRGDAVTGYVVELDSSPTFSSPALTTVSLPVSQRVQKVYTDAHTLPFDAGARFALGFGDFKGSFVTLVGGAERNLTLVDARSGDTKLTRSKDAFRDSVKAGFDARNLQVARGDFVRVGGQEFRVCLSTDGDFAALYGLSYSASELPLCAADDPWSAAPYDGGNRADDLAGAPLFALDTALGAAWGAAQGGAALAPRCAPTARAST